MDDDKFEAELQSQFRFKPQPELEPTEDELEKALPDLFYAACQCSTFHYWFLVAKPVAARDADQANKELLQLIDNGIIEVTLLFIRKTAEFFWPKKGGDRKDTIFSYRYSGYIDQGIILDEEIYDELHKRVGHITIREARYGKKYWPIPSLVFVALNKWADFFEYLSQHPEIFGGRHVNDCRHYCRTLTEMLGKINSMVKET
jgi:hypothetical protein